MGRKHDEAQPAGVERQTYLGRSLRIAVLGLLGAVPAFAGSTVPDGGQLERLARVRVPFVQNKGQLPRSVGFSASTFFGTVFVGHDGRLAYSLPAEHRGRDPGQENARAAGARLTETLVGAKVFPTAGARAQTGVSYFLGNDPRRWQCDLPTFEEVSLGEAWPGVSVVLRAHARNVEKVFTILPGASVGRIRLRVDGVGPLAIAPDGALVAGAGSSRVRFSPPFAYQERDGVRRPVSVTYDFHGSTYGFRVGAYDRATPLVVDPVLQSSYIGGANPDSINAIAIDPSSGDVLVAGYTFSTSGRGVDGMVARFDPTLTRLLHATYFGGTHGDEILGVAVHPASGDVYVAGFTSSTDLPDTVAGAQPANAGSDDGFVARLDPTLAQLLGSTYLGGGDLDRIVAIAIHPASGEIYVAGQAISTDFPGTDGGAQPSPASEDRYVQRDGFIARLDPTLGTLLQATYLGGDRTEFLHALAIHPLNGDIYVAGQTRAFDFPGAVGGANAAWYPFTLNPNGFVARLDPSLTHVIQSTYIGSSGSNDALGIAIHPGSGEIYVVGWTDWIDLPGTDGGAQPVAAGETDAFVERFNAELTELLQASYLGGTDADYAYGVTVHPTRGDVYVTGETYSTDLPGTVRRGTVHSRRRRRRLRRQARSEAHAVRSGDLSGRRRRRRARRGRHPAGRRPGPRRGHDDLARPSRRSGRLTGRLCRRRRVLRRRRLRDSAAGRPFRGEQRMHCERDDALPEQSPVLGPGRLASPFAGEKRRRNGRAALRRHRLLLVLQRRQRRARRQGPGRPRGERLHVGVYGALTNVEYTITVTDTDTGTVQTYANPAGTLRSFADTTAFADSIASRGIGSDTVGRDRREDRLEVSRRALRDVRDPDGRDRAVSWPKRPVPARREARHSASTTSDSRSPSTGPCRAGAGRVTARPSPPRRTRAISGSSAARTSS